MKSAHGIVLFLFLLVVAQWGHARGIAHPSFLEFPGINSILNGDGVKYPTLASAVAACPNPGEVDVPSGTYLVSANLTVPTTCSLRFDGGAVASVANGVTLTINGPLIAPNTQIFSYTGTGTVALGTLATPAYASWFPGSDIGVQINNAYKALPANGGSIFITQPSGGNTYSYSTPIVLATSGKMVSLYGTAGNANTIQLNYTPTTATSAITADWTPNGGTAESPGAGFENFTLINNGCTTAGGCGSSATGITWGGTNWGGQAAYISNVQILGFGTAETWSSGQSWGQYRTNETIADNTTGWSNAQSLENMSTIASRFAGNGTCISSSSGDWYFTSVSFDQTQTGPCLSVSAGHYHAYMSHFETCNTTSCSTHFVNATGMSDVEISGGFALLDYTTSATDYIFQSSGYSLVIDDLQLATAGEGVSTAVVNFPSTQTNAFIKIINHSSGTIPMTSMIGGGSNANNVSNLSTPNGGNAGWPVQFGQAPPQLQIFSQALGTDSQLNFGRTATEQFIAGIGSAGDCATGSTAGDFCIRNSNSGNLISLTVGETPSFSLTNTGIKSTQGLQSFNRSSTCTTPARAGATCTTAPISLPVGYPDTNYRVSVTGLGPTNSPAVQTVTKSNTSFTVTIEALTGAAAAYSSFDFIVTHN